MKILCIGHAAYDITVPLTEYPIENTKNRVPERIECGGGPASNAAYLLAKWNMDTYFAGIVGNDNYGNIIENEFKSVGVNIDYLEKSDELATTSSFIIANSSNGSRTILTYRPKTMKMKDFDIDFEPDIILIDGQEKDASIKMMEKYPNAISIIDAGTAREDVVLLADMVDYVVCSKDYAETVTGIKAKYEDPDTLVRIYNTLKKKYTKNVIVTLEGNGSMYEKDGIVKIMPSIKVDTKDSTAAGDIFHGAFTYFIANGYSLLDAIHYSSITSAISRPIASRSSGVNSSSVFLDIVESPVLLVPLSISALP